MIQTSDQVELFNHLLQNYKGLRFKLNCCVQNIYITYKLLMLNRNTWNYLTLYLQMINIKYNHYC